VAARRQALWHWECLQHSLTLTVTSFAVLHLQGKILMLITNSDFGYTNKMMSFAYDEYLPDGKTWRDLFDMVRLCRRSLRLLQSP
jgi:hypothetical protein